MSGGPTIRSAPWRWLVVLVLVPTLVGCSRDGRPNDDVTAGGKSSSTSSSIAKGPLPDCRPYEDAQNLLVDPSARLRTSAGVSQGDLTFVAIALEGASDPILVVRFGDGSWRALDNVSASATGLAEVSGGDENASRSALGAQKAVTCLGEGAP